MFNFGTCASKSENYSSRPKKQYNCSHFVKELFYVLINFSTHFETK